MMQPTYSAEEVIEIVKDCTDPTALGALLDVVAAEFVQYSRLDRVILLFVLQERVERLMTMYNLN